MPALGDAYHASRLEVTAAAPGLLDGITQYGPRRSRPFISDEHPAALAACGRHIRAPYRPPCSATWQPAQRRRGQRDTWNYSFDSLDLL